MLEWLVCAANGVTVWLRMPLLATFIWLMPLSLEAIALESVYHRMNRISNNQTK